MNNLTKCAAALLLIAMPLTGCLSPKNNKYLAKRAVNEYLTTQGERMDKVEVLSIDSVTSPIYMDFPMTMSIRNRMKNIDTLYNDLPNVREKKLRGELIAKADSIFSECDSVSSVWGTYLANSFARGDKYEKNRLAAICRIEKGYQSHNVAFVFDQKSRKISHILEVEFNKQFEQKMDLAQEILDLRSDFAHYVELTNP